MRKRRALCALPGIVAVIFLATVGFGGCTGGKGGSGAIDFVQSDTDTQAAAEDSPPSVCMPAFIEELDLASPSDCVAGIAGVKQVSADDPTGRFCYGAGFMGASENVEISLNSAIFCPEGDWAWAMYQFRYDPRAMWPATWPDQIWFNGVFSVSSPGEDEVWIGLANWERGVWEWFNAEDYGYCPFDPPGSFDPYRRPLEPFYDQYETLTIMMIGGDATEILEWCRLGSYVPPEARLEIISIWENIDPPGWEVWFDADDSIPYDGWFLNYDWDWESDGEWDLEDGSFWETHIYEEPGEYTATVRARGWDFPWFDDYDEASVTFELPPW